MSNFFKSWEHIKCWSHVGSVERAAFILHVDSMSPYGDHVSMYVAMLLMDDCWVQHFVYVLFFLNENPWHLKLGYIHSSFSVVFFSLTVCLCTAYVELQQLGFSHLCPLMPLFIAFVLFLIMLHIIHTSHGCLHRTPGPW